MVDHFNTYLYQKRGFYYFSRRVPQEIHKHFPKHRIVLALNTRSRAKALKCAQVICQRLDERWLPMRLDALGLGNVVAHDVKPIDVAPTLSEATQQYLQLKGMGKAKTFHQAAMRNAGTVIEICGDRVVTEYRTTDAGQVRDVLISKGLSVLSVRRSFTTIKAIINLAIAEHGLDMRNPFSSIFMPEADSKKRVSIPVDTIREIQEACYQIDDDRRWLIALISDTGMRLAEAAGLHIEDLHLDEEIPYVDIKPHPWRSLKTKGSQRQVPLVGASLWAAQRIKQSASSTFAFDRYTDNQQCRANSASNTLNKWMQSHFREDIVIHGFRHALRDRLRAEQCPSEMMDQIGGWSSGKIGEGYGDGFNREVLVTAMKLIMPANLQCAYENTQRLKDDSAS
jgi:integrase